MVFVLVEKRELLEIAKTNAAKTFGTDIALPASLRISTQLKEKESVTSDVSI